MYQLWTLVRSTSPMHWKTHQILRKKRMSYVFGSEHWQANFQRQIDMYVVRTGRSASYCISWCSTFQYLSMFYFIVAWMWCIIVVNDFINEKINTKNCYVCAKDLVFTGRIGHEFNFNSTIFEDFVNRKMEF